MTTQSIEKPNFSEEFDEIWRRLTHNQRRFVVQVMDTSTKKEAAEILGIKPAAVYAYPDEVDRAIELYQDHVKNAAMIVLTDNLARAAMIKVAGMDSDDDRISQAAATEILDRSLGKAAQPITGAEGGSIVISWDDTNTD